MDGDDVSKSPALLDFLKGLGLIEINRFFARTPARMPRDVVPIASGTRKRVIPALILKTAHLLTGSKFDLSDS